VAQVIAGARPAQLASCLMSAWIMSPGRLPTVATTKTFWEVKVSSGVRPGPFMSAPTVERGAPEGHGDAAERAALVPAVYSLLRVAFCGSSVRRLGCGDTPSIRQCRYAACSKPGEPTCKASTQADPGLCCKGYGTWPRLIRDAGGNEPSPD